MKVSSCQFSLKPSTEEEFWERVSAQVGRASREGSRIVLLPEYFSLACILGRSKGDIRSLILENSPWERNFLDGFRRLSEENNVCIVAGSHPHVEGNSIFNRSWIFQPGISPVYQDKVNMTRFEAEQWNIQAGRAALQTFSVAGAICAIAVCYDVEFPAYCSAAAEAGVEILLVPSCTDDAHGYWRVRRCAEARAVENQCYVVMSSIVGGSADRAEIASHFGKGGIFSPSDTGFPAGGLIALGEENAESVVTAELDLDLLKKIRKNGTVLNLRDSGLQKKLELLR